MVCKWMDRFDEEGPSGLYDRDREGRPPKIDEEAEQEIERLIEGNPTEEGENATRWKTGRIAEYLDRELGVDVHPETVREALNRLDYSWTRPRRKLPSTSPEAYRERLDAIVQAVSRAGPDASVLARDETTIKRFPPLRRQWQPVGEQRPVMVPASNDDFTLYGTLDLTSGTTHVRAYEKGRPSAQSNTSSLFSGRPRAKCFWSGIRPSGTPPRRYGSGSTSTIGLRPICCRPGLRTPIRWRISGENSKNKWPRAWNGASTRCWRAQSNT